MSAYKVDVLAMMDAQIAAAKALQSDAFYAQELPKLVDARSAVAELIEVVKEMNRLAKGPAGGVSLADKRAIVGRANAALANIGSTP